MALDPRGAVELMVDRGPATVVATGPLTNVAALLEHSPQTVRGHRLDGRLDRARQHAPLRRVQRAGRSRGGGDRVRQRQAADHGGPQPDPSGAGHARGRRAPARGGQPRRGGGHRLADVLRRHLPHRLRHGRAPGARRLRAGADDRSGGPAQRRDLRGHRDRRALDARGDGGRPPRAPRTAAQREGGHGARCRSASGTSSSARSERCDRRRRLHQPRPRGGRRAPPDAGRDGARWRPPRAAGRQGRQSGRRGGAPGRRGRDGRPRRRRCAGRAPAQGPCGRGRRRRARDRGRGRALRAWR